MPNLPHTYETPCLLWADDDDVPGFPGLYVSPNTFSLPEVNKEHLKHRPGHNARSSLPWHWLSPRFSDQQHFWTALSLKKPEYTGLLEPLSSTQVEVFVGNGQLRWKLKDAQKWSQLEAFLKRLMSSIKRQYPLSHLTPILVELEGDNFPWPSTYPYTVSWHSQSVAKRSLRTARAAFMLTITKITYAATALPDGWVEGFLRSGDLTAKEAYLIRSSPICQTTDPISGTCIERIGMIVDVTKPHTKSHIAELEDLINRLSLPVWLYYGQRPAVSQHPWSAAFLPARDEVDSCRRSYNKGPNLPRATMDWYENDVLDGWGERPQPPTSNAAPVPSSSSQWTPVYTQTMSTALHTQSSASSSTDQHGPPSRCMFSNDRSVAAPPPKPAPQRDAVTRQLPGETPEQFFEHAERDNTKRRARMRPTELAEVEARAKEYSSIDQPNQNDKCRVFEWVEDNGMQIRSKVHTPLQQVVGITDHSPHYSSPHTTPASGR
ncbi:hypothetical protein BDY19DRAFT_904412 [Irpex rosettiformis]|uniref:Uncharacterized protein n=1 Tax=Irpex rosettiformis TaxID=378272 RepID=A0ACB8UC83_9APHY|nr:hypothetical protein BDY19DRAFT_904412 [Irpex rosettiformis]